MFVSEVAAKMSSLEDLRLKPSVESAKANGNHSFILIEVKSISVWILFMNIIWEVVA